MTTARTISPETEADEEATAYCKRCRGTTTEGTGYVIESHQPSNYPFPIDYGRKCDCFGRIEQMRLIRGAQIPRVLLEKSLNGFLGEGTVHRKVRADIRAFLKGKLPKRGLFLRGGTGSGKSHVAAHCLKIQIDQTLKPGLWVNYPEIFEELRAIYGAGDAAIQSEESFLDVFRRVAFLVIDDLGVTDANPNQRDTATYKIINARLEAGLSTIVTTNLEDTALAERIGERSVSRLYDMCSVIDFPAMDYRRQAA